MQPSLYTLYSLLHAYFGFQNWWPVDRNYHTKHNSDERFEIIIGAILTQNTAWINVEKALLHLKKNNIFTIESIAAIDEKILQNLIRPSGFFNQKAHRLKNIAQYLHNTYQDNLDKLFHQESKKLRKELLSLSGVGPETADSILLYAGNHPFFVVDAYTKRLCKRLPLPTENNSYDDIQQFFQNQLQKEIKKDHLITVYKEFHALIVELAKNFCRKKPDCVSCPIHECCNYRSSPVNFSRSTSAGISGREIS